MKRQSSKLLPLFCVLLAIGVASAAWFFLRSAPTAESGVGGGDERATATTSTEERNAASLQTPELPTNAASTPSQQKVEDRKNVATPAELELADALWVSGRLVYPEGTPIGEEVEVVASGRKFKTRPPYRARVAPNGSFRVAFAKETKTGSVDVDAPHLFLREAAKVKPADPKRTEELVLEPLLGGRIQGQLIVPANGLSLASQLAGKSVHAEGWSEGYDDHMSRVGAVDKAMRFELRGLSPECAFQLGFHSELFAVVNRSDIRVAAGEDLAFQLPLTLGARVRGRVSDAGGEKLTSTNLEFQTQQDEQPGESSSSAEAFAIGVDRSVSVKIEPDGSFDARGILPGKIQITANAPQRLPAVLELGMVADGEVREGVELVLELGGRVGGRVLWPDGSPAAEARVHLQALAEDNESGSGMPNFLFDVASARADAQGAFLISGLAAKRFNVLAQARPEAEASSRGGSKGRSQAWRASFDDVPVDKLDLELKLHGGSTIQGVVVDDLGAPVTRFAVSAEQQSEGYDPLAHTASSIYTPADGRFELGGLLDASYQIRVTAIGHDAPEEVEITLPADSRTLSFVARRRARVSGVVLRPDGE
ncbi:MAG TPA: carboxypeptidase-like regulatory domain-containing protein, partial [Planctomycetota bacterium]|nr:carboxypeptidase-like regulatory domain-containing protein [Planctomycetota bacterium]